MISYDFFAHVDWTQVFPIFDQSSPKSSMVQRSLNNEQSTKTRALGKPEHIPQIKI